jgi:lysophospholipase L1-like esterase
MKQVVLTPKWFEGAISFEKRGGGLKPWRLPFAERGLFPSPAETLLARAEMAAGVRLRFETDARAVGLRVAPDKEKRIYDLTLGPKLLASVTLDEQRTDALFDGLPAGRKVLELWLPQKQATVARRLLLSDGAAARLVADKRPKWVTYGSSITHCGAAHSPARTWPGVVARAMGWNLTCLGYGGQCHFDPMVARMIRDLPADYISLKLGINVMGGSSLSRRTFRPGIIGLVKIIREKHPRTPITVVSPIISPPRETTPNAVGMTLTIMREEARDAVDRLIAAGDRNLRYVSGLELFGPGEVGYLPDQLHPNGDGYELLGRNFVKKVARKMAR